MKNIAFKIIITFTLLYSIDINLFAQPFTLDEDLKPTLLELKENNSGKGKLIIANADLNDKEQFYHVKGYTMFEYIDVWVFANFGNPNFKVDLVHHNWKDVAFTANTADAEDGIIRFRLRAFDPFGLKIYPSDDFANITIAIHASKPVKNYLESPFRKANAAELETEQVEIEANLSKEDKISFFNEGLIYMLLGLAIAIIGFLIYKLKSKSMTIVLILIIPTISLAQDASFSVEIWENKFLNEDDFGLDRTSYNDYLDRLKEAQIKGGNYRKYTNWEEDKKRVDTFLDQLNGKINTGVELYKATNAFFDAYQGLGSCLNTGPRPGAPKVPSFCEANGCSTCFIDARAALMENTYTLEMLKTIYDCNKNYTDVAIAFGNTWSSLAGGHGMAWGMKRIKIEKSIETLKKSYDKKYKELMTKRMQLLMELNNCEQQYGIKDWYDRFGYIIYQFDAQYYKRSS